MNKKVIKTASITFTLEELDYIAAAIDYIFERYHDEGKDIESFGDPKIMKRIRTKAENTLKKLE